MLNIKRHYTYSVFLKTKQLPTYKNCYKNLILVAVI